MTTKERILAALDEARGGFLSGEELSERLGITRAAVWKAIKVLQGEGYSIDAVTNRGYSLSENADILSEACIEGLLKAELPITLDVRREVTSTNTLLKELAASGAPEGTVLAASSQTLGRGRVGRSFFSPPGSGLYISILLRPEFDMEEAAMLTTAAAAATAMACERLSGRETGIKWVNDVWLGSKKLSGILTEASVSVENGGLDYVIVGIGVNVYEPEGGFPEELGSVAAALFPAGADSKNARSRLAAEILNIFTHFYAHMASREYFAEYKKRLFILGKDIVILRGGDAIPAKALDIDNDCHLLVRYPDGRQEYLSSGEISIRPALTEE